MIRCPCKFMGKGIMGNHEVCLLFFPLIICLCLCIKTSCQFSRLGECPCKIFVAVLPVTFPFLFTIAHPFCMHLAAIRNIVPCIRKALNMPCFKHYGQGDDLADAGYCLKIAVRLL